MVVKGAVAEVVAGVVAVVGAEVVAVVVAEAVETVMKAMEEVVVKVKVKRMIEKMKEVETIDAAAVGVMRMKVGAEVQKVII